MASTSSNNTETCRYIAISPSGEEIVTLCDNILETWYVKNEENPNGGIENKIVTTEFKCKILGIKTEAAFSLAISNATGAVGNNRNTLIALSCFNFNKENNEEELTSVVIDKINEFSIELHETLVISTSTNSRNKVLNVYGYLQFFKNDILLISNHLGITRVGKDDSTSLSKGPRYLHQIFTKAIKYESINYHEQYGQSSCYNKNDSEIIGYPNNFIEGLKEMDEKEKLDFIRNCVVGGKLFVHNEENNIEMYNVYSRNMDMLYHHSKFQEKFANNIFAISKNAKLLAVTINNSQQSQQFQQSNNPNNPNNPSNPNNPNSPNNHNDSISLYLNENSLNIANKKFPIINGKITYMAFFNNDEKLLLLDEDEYPIIWNIFKDESERNNEYQIKKNQIANSSGRIVFIGDHLRPQLFKLVVDLVEPLNPPTKNPATNACDKLITFYEQKTELSRKEYIESVEKNKDTIRNLIRAKPELWKLLDVKDKLMEKLINSRSNDIVELILNKKLHIPQLYEWDGSRKSEHELLIALECNNIEIIQQLLKYYSDNAMENVGWMITLTQALPKINEKFPEYITELFNKPVFYQKKIHLAKSRIKSILSSKNSSYAAFIIDTRLPILSKMENRENSKSHDSLNNHNIEIYMTPLPDFNEFAKGHKNIINCPFFKLMSQNNLNLIIYKKNPTLEAIINFYWDIHLPQLALRLIFYLIYFLIFNSRLYLLYSIPFIKYKGNKIILAINLCIIVFYLIVLCPKFLELYTFISFKTKPTYYQIFYWISYFSQLSTLILFVIAYFCDLYTSHLFINFISLTTLVVWIELFLFLRFLPVVGEYIIIILYLVSTIIPYFLALMIMILGFSFSFHVLFMNAARLGIKPEGETYNVLKNGTLSDIIIEQQMNIPNFFETLETAYLWLFGSWDNIKNWNYIPIKILAILASFFLVTMMTNIFVASMLDNISKAKRYSEIASFKYKVDYILESHYYPLILLFKRFEKVHDDKDEKFEDIFYHKSTFHSLLDRHIFYIKSDKKDWKTEISKGTDELIEKLSDKHDNDVRNINEKIKNLDEKFNEVRNIDEKIEKLDEKLNEIRNILMN